MTTPRELKRLAIFRICMFLGAVTYGFWWVISVYGNHNKWDPLYLRLTVSSILAAIGLLSYVAPFFKKNLEYFSFAAIVVVLGHYFLVMAKNDVSANIGSGLYIVITMSAFCLQRLSLMLLYDLFGIIFVYLTFTNVTNPTLKPFQILFGFISIMIASHATMLIRIRLEKNLETEAENFQNLFNSTFEGLALVKNGKVYQTNFTFDQIFQVSILNRQLSQIIDLQSGNDFITEGFKGYDKTKILLQVKKKPLLLNNEHVDLFSVTDITAEAEQKAKLANTNKLASLGEMSSGIANEINNPLAIIQSSTELLKDFIEQPVFERPQALKQIGVIQKTIERVSKIIIGLRHFSRDAATDDFKFVSAEQLVEEVLSFCDAALKSKGIFVEKNIEPIQIYCQQVQIEQVLLNLINNATFELDHVLLEKRRLCIHIFAANDKIVIEVEDSGRGIPKPMQLKLFQPFFTTKPIGTGTGLGLSISKGIIDSHRGQIYYDSEAPMTRFVIVLPQKQLTPA